jgi:hypothetical protein
MPATLSCIRSLPVLLLLLLLLLLPLRWLVDGADKDTSLFLFYTGHGGQLPGKPPSASC